MEGAEFEALVEDIRVNGLQHPILLDAEGRVLDGRNRLRACRGAGVEPRFERWTPKVGDGSALEAVISLNVRRRHLNESQRALVAARLAPQLKQYEKTNKSCPNLYNSGRTGRAAGMLNVSRGSVENAKKVLNSGDSGLIQAVESGAVAVSAAVNALDRPAAPALRPRAEASGRFRAIYVDPSWTSPLPKQLPAAAAAGALLFLWTTPENLAQGVRAIERWGFRYQTCLAWVGAGSPAPTGLLLIGGRGLVLTQSLAAPRARPDSGEIYRTIEPLCPPGPKARLFAAPRKGWEEPALE
jgi:hypothetical protein